MRPLNFICVLLLTGFLLGFSSKDALAEAVIPSPTAITFNDFFLDFIDDNELSLTPLGTADLSLPVLTLPVTGVTVLGTLEQVAVEHEGSGLGIAGGPLNLSVNLQNLVIDTVALNVVGDLDVNGLVPPSTPLTLFELVGGQTQGELDLLVSSDLAGIMSTFLGIDDLAGVNIASLTTPQAVPLPPAAWLFLTALCSVSIFRKVAVRA